jgi:hypothetical protein
LTRAETHAGQFVEARQEFVWEQGVDKRVLVRVKRFQLPQTLKYRRRELAQLVVVQLKRLEKIESLKYACGQRADHVG